MHPLLANACTVAATPPSRTVIIRILLAGRLKFARAGDGTATLCACHETGEGKFMLSRSWCALVAENRLGAVILVQSNHWYVTSSVDLTGVDEVSSIKDIRKQPVER